VALISPIRGLLALVLSATPCLGQQLADPKLTPGKIRHELDTRAVCTTKWGKDERVVTEEMKKQVYAEYHLVPNKGACKPIPHKNKKGETVIPKSGCEIDHRVSRELAGADDMANLWAQPYLTPQQPGAYAKDRLENFLHRQVCSGKLTLKQAQDALLGDWYAAYQKYIGPLPAK